jgi:hypothetical protein
MDPNSVLNNIREKAAEFYEATDYETAEYIADGILADFHALDAWLTEGGFLPTRWTTPRKDTRNA